MTNRPRPQLQAERREGDYFMQWGERAILAILLLVLIICGVLFWVTVDTKQTIKDARIAADNSAAQTIANRDAGLRNRAVSCSLFRTTVSPDRYAAFAPCQEPEVQKYIITP